jgi:NAD(P)-dependent dehydrogenase (short-subunit alcohol dehydrogenase family)
MATIIVTGSAGLIGSETVKRFARDGACVVGIDNDMRKFQQHYPAWQFRYGLREMLEEIQIAVRTTRT